MVKGEPPIVYRDFADEGDMVRQFWAGLDVKPSVGWAKEGLGRGEPKGVKGYQYEAPPNLLGELYIAILLFRSNTRLRHFARDRVLRLDLKH